MKGETKVIEKIPTTSPVHPTSAADVILSVMMKASCLSLFNDLSFIVKVTCARN